MKSLRSLDASEREMWTCNECGKASVWSKGWSYCYGINPYFDGVSCSSDCEDSILQRIGYSVEPPPFTQSVSAQYAKTRQGK